MCRRCAAAYAALAARASFPSWSCRGPDRLTGADRIAAIQEELKATKQRLKAGGGSGLPKPAELAARAEDELGRLMPGMYADFTVLSEDIVDGTADVFLRAKVLLTVMGGRDTHRATSGSPR